MSNNMVKEWVEFNRLQVYIIIINIPLGIGCNCGFLHENKILFSISSAKNREFKMHNFEIIFSPK